MITIGLRHTALALVLLLPLGGALAQSDDASYMKPLRAAEDANPPLAAFDRMDTLGPAELDALRNQQDLQRLGTFRSLAGDADGAARAYGLWMKLVRTPANPADDATEIERMQQASAEDALTAILREARGKQVVILNEAHLNPTNRVFASRLAHALRAIGFDYLACETFRDIDRLPLDRGYVSRDAGFYSKEPMYGEFLRAALRDKWTFVGYDPVADIPESLNSSDAFRWREEHAIENLKRRIFAKDPKAKVFLYVGFGHVIEHGKPGKPPALAELLRTRLGIDPLTIDQSTMFSYPDRAAESPLYRPALARSQLADAFVLKSKDGYEVVGKYQGQVDMQVFQPDEGRIDTTGRPVWMRIRAGLKPQPVPAGLMPAQGRRLIQAFHEGDPADAVPADMVMVEAGKPAPMLMLGAGQYRYAYED